MSVTARCSQTVSVLAQLKAAIHLRSPVNSSTPLVCVMQVYLTLLLQWAGYWLWAVYLSNVLPNEVGARRPWNYYLRPSYWRPRPTDTTGVLQQLLADEAAVREAGWLCWDGQGMGRAGGGSKSAMQV